MNGIRRFALGLLALLGSVFSTAAAAQEPAAGELPAPLVDQTPPGNSCCGLTSGSSR